MVALLVSRQRGLHWLWAKEHDWISVNARPPRVDDTFWHLLEHPRLTRRDILTYLTDPGYGQLSGTGPAQARPPVALQEAQSTQAPFGPQMLAAWQSVSLVQAKHLRSPVQ